MKRMLIIAGIAAFLLMGYFTRYADAGDEGAKDEAVAMMKKAIEYIKATSNEKAFEELLLSRGREVNPNEVIPLDESDF